MNSGDELAHASERYQLKETVDYGTAERHLTLIINANDKGCNAWNTMSTT